MPWNSLIGALEITAGVVLVVVTFNKRWVTWSAKKPFFVPYVVLLMAVIGISEGVAKLLKAFFLK